MVSIYDLILISQSVCFCQSKVGQYVYIDALGAIFISIHILVN